MIKSGSDKEEKMNIDNESPNTSLKDLLGRLKQRGEALFKRSKTPTTPEPEIIDGNSVVFQRELDRFKTVYMDGLRVSIDRLTPQQVKYLRNIGDHGPTGSNSDWSRALLPEAQFTNAAYVVVATMEHLERMIKTGSVLPERLSQDEFERRGFSVIQMANGAFGVVFENVIYPVPPGSIADYGIQQGFAVPQADTPMTP